MSHEPTTKLDYQRWQQGNALVPHEDALLRLSLKDGQEGLSRSDLERAVADGEALPPLPGFTEPAETREPGAYLARVREYAEWKERYAPVWQRFQCTSLFAGEAQTLYETLRWADRCHVAANDLLTILDRRRVARLPLAHQIATMRSYVIFKEAHDFQEQRGGRTITPDFQDFTSAVMQDFLNGVLVVSEPPQACFAGRHFSGNYEYASREFGGAYYQVGADVKEDPLWLRYVTIHEGYHHYLARTEGPQAIGDEVRVHHASMNYFYDLTKGIGFDFRPEQSLFAYGTWGTPDACHEEAIALIEKNMQRFPEVLKRRYRRMADEIVSFKTGMISAKARLHSGHFFQQMYESSHGELAEGKPVASRYPDLRKLYGASSGAGTIRGNVLNIMNNMIIGLVGYYAVVPAARARYPGVLRRGVAKELAAAKNLDEVLAYFKKNLTFDIPETIPAGAYTRGEYVTPEGKRFSPLLMLEYYILSQLHDPQETAGFLPTILEAFERYPAS